MIRRCTKSFGECGGNFDEVELPGGIVPLEDGRLLMVNSDWYYVELTLDVTTFEPWKRSETDPRSQLKEHRCMVVQVLPDK